MAPQERRTTRPSPTRKFVRSGPRRRASRRQSFALPSRDSELSQRRRQAERLRRVVLSRGKSAVWQWLLGIAACCEFLTFLFSKRAIKEEQEGEEESWWSYFWHTREDEELPSMESAVLAFESPPLTILYSLYFVDAFVQAYNMRERTCRSNEKARLLHSGEWSERRFYRDPSFVLVVTLLLYLSMLPTWFWWEVLSFLGIHLMVSSSFVRESAVETPQYSLFYAISVHFYHNLSTAIKTTLDEQAIVLERTIKRRLARFFIFHPRTFIRRYKKVQLAIIWLKYIAPIGAHVMNSDFVGVMIDLAKKWGQEANERYQQLLRRSTWLRLDDECRRELAAVVIQRNYRSYVSRKWVRLVKFEVQKREEEVIRLVQEAIKKRSQLELQEQEMALDELELLQKHAELNRNAPKVNQSLTLMFNPLASIQPKQHENEEDLKRRYELQVEIQRKLKLEKEKLMLIRPDSRFVFRYSLVYVACALIETAHLVLLPRLDEDDVTEEESCATDALRFFFRHANGFVNLILCFGILIKFFVGEFDPVTGRLVPRSFFSRWIYPGILLHLIVNPALSEISSGVTAVLTFMLKAGPGTFMKVHCRLFKLVLLLLISLTVGRMWRWWVLFLFPLWRRLSSLLEWRIWIKLVQRENQNLTGLRQRDHMLRASN